MPSNPGSPQEAREKCTIPGESEELESPQVPLVKIARELGQMQRRRRWDAINSRESHRGRAHGGVAMITLCWIRELDSSELNPADGLV